MTPSRHEMELLLTVIKQHMDMDLRAKVMREVPQAYNAWCGHEIVKVIHASDGRAVRQP
jgi:hypothetical protein